MLLKIFALLLPLLTHRATATSAVEEQANSCVAAFDVFFICDESGSIGHQLADYGVPFMRNMIGNMSGSTGFRTSIIYFGGTGVSVHLDSEGDGDTIEAKLQELELADAAGGSSYSQDGLHEAMHILFRELEDLGANTPSVVFFMFDGQNSDSLENYVVPKTDYMKGGIRKADGQPQDWNDDLKYSNLPDELGNSLKDLVEANMPSPFGTYIYTLGIGSSANEGYLSQLCSTPDEDFLVLLADWNELDGIVEDISSRFCLDVTDPQPTELFVCHVDNVLVSTQLNFTIYGVGFDAAFAESPVYLCSLDAVEYPATFISSTEMTCHFDFETHVGVAAGQNYSSMYDFNLEVSVDGGVTWTRTTTRTEVFVSDCDCVILGFDYDQQDVLVTVSDSALHCMELCQGSDDCLFWSWANNEATPATCWLKDSDVGFEEQSNRDSGPKFCSDVIPPVVTTATDSGGGGGTDSGATDSGTDSDGGATGDSGTDGTDSGTDGTDSGSDTGSGVGGGQDSNPGSEEEIAGGIPSEPMDPTILAIILGLVAFMLLFCLWFLWPLLCGVPAVPAPKPKPQPVAMVAVAAPAPAPAAVEAPAENTKKWKTVEASNYIWARSGGGAAPIKTEWGNLGATSSAPAAKVIEVEIDSGPAPAAPKATPAVVEAPSKPASAPRESCCDKLNNCCFECYRSCAAMRPSRTLPEKMLDTGARSSSTAAI